MGKLRDSLKSRNFPIKKSLNKTILGKGANKWTWCFKMVHQEKRQPFIPKLSMLTWSAFRYKSTQNTNTLWKLYCSLINVIARHFETQSTKTGSLCYQKWTCPIKEQLSLRPREIPESIILRVLTFFCVFHFAHPDDTSFIAFLCGSQTNWKVMDFFFDQLNCFSQWNPWSFE